MRNRLTGCSPSLVSDKLWLGDLAGALGGLGLLTDGGAALFFLIAPDAVLAVP